MHDRGSTGARRLGRRRHPHVRLQESATQQGRCMPVDVEMAKCRLGQTPLFREGQFSGGSPVGRLRAAFDVEALRRSRARACGGSERGRIAEPIGFNSRCCIDSSAVGSCITGCWKIKQAGVAGSEMKTSACRLTGKRKRVHPDARTRLRNQRAATSQSRLRVPAMLAGGQVQDEQGKQVRSIDAQARSGHGLPATLPTNPKQAKRGCRTAPHIGGRSSVRGRRPTIGRNRAGRAGSHEKRTGDEELRLGTTHVQVERSSRGSADTREAGNTASRDSASRAP